jgi:hypothetical protein
MSRNDPHADIQTLCDALSIAILLLYNEDAITLPDAEAEAVNARLYAIDDAAEVRLEIMKAAMSILARSRAVH